MKSMTGYGNAEGKVGKGWVFIEVRSVNHRYNDITLKLPPKLHVLDHKFRQAIQRVIGRGKVELFLKERQDVEPAPRAVVNIPLAKAYERCLRELERSFTKGGRHQLLDVIPLRDLIRIEEPTVNYERLWNEIQRICHRALLQMDRMRGVEGAHLKRDQAQRLKAIERYCTQIDRQIVKNKQALQAEFQDNESRNLQNGHEALTAAMDRIDISEELTRLGSHVAQYRSFVTRTEPVGRQLDFLIQEMNREINTIASKGGNALISQLAVEVKSELEKLREQAQNIE